MQNKAAIPEADEYSQKHFMAHLHTTKCLDHIRPVIVQVPAHETRHLRTIAACVM
jgi:hypothetical protein